MSKTIELSDEEYAILEAAAVRGNETPEQVLTRIVRALAGTSGPVYYNLDDMFNALDEYEVNVDAGQGNADE